MSVYAHTDDKSKHKLGEASDLNGIGDGTAFNAIRTINTQLKANNKKFQFAYSGGKYGYTIDGTFYPFKNPVGTRSITANGTYNIADYASVNVNVANKAVLVAQYATDPFAGAYNQGLLACNLTGYSAVILKISGLNAGNNKYIYLTKGTETAVGDWSGTSGGGRGYVFLADGSGIKENVQGNSYGAWGSQWCSEIWGLVNPILG